MRSLETGGNIHARQHAGGWFPSTVVLEAMLWEQMPSLKTQVILDTGIKNIIETLVFFLSGFHVYPDTS